MTTQRGAARPAAILLFLLIAGCQAKSAAPPDAPAETPSLRIIATDEGHQAPDSIMAGLRHLRFENHGSVIHEGMLVRLPDGMTAADYSAAVASGSMFPEGAIDCSGPGLTSPGESMDMWVALEPGRHILACWPRHPPGKGPSHVAQGPVHEIVVSTRVENDPVPAEDAVIRLVDYRIELEGEIRSGTRTLRIETVGPSMHEMDVYRLHDGRTVDDLRAWQANKRTTPSPATSVGGVLDSHEPNRTVWLRREFQPGRYVAWCGMDMPVAADAKPLSHADVGMVLEFTVRPK
jgi:hypothetical protein